MHETGEIVSLLERTERLLAAIERIDVLCRQSPAITCEQRDKLIVSLLAEQEKGSA